MKYVLQGILPELWNRESLKQSHDRVTDAKFDLRYEVMCKEKGVANKI